jgi:hypothetical protein
MKSFRSGFGLSGKCLESSRVCGLKKFRGFGRFVGLESSRVYGHRMEGWVRCYLGKAVSKGV